MDWYDEAQRDRTLREEKKEALHRDAENLFNDLWDTLVKEADRINKKDGNLRLYRNGSPLIVSSGSISFWKMRQKAARETCTLNSLPKKIKSLLMLQNSVL